MSKTVSSKGGFTYSYDWEPTNNPSEYAVLIPITEHSNPYGEGEKYYVWVRRHGTNVIYKEDALLGWFELTISQI